jgi:hypothetical protein
MFHSKLRFLELKNTQDREMFVIFPLEWQFYFRDEYSSPFLNWLIEPGIWFDFSEYYYDFPLIEKIEFALRRINLKHIAAGLTRRFTKSAAEIQRSRFETVVVYKELGIRGDVKVDSRGKRGVNGKSCNQIVWPRSQNISRVINWAANRLAALQSARGVKVILTWPAVAGANCYDVESEVAPVAARIRAVFERAGIAVVGDPARSSFSEEHVVDTYYHIDAAGARERTRLLVEDLKAAGLAPAPARILPVSSIMDAALERQQLERIQSLRALQGGDFSPGKGSFGSYFQLSAQGWYQTDDLGVWSRGGRCARADLHRTLSGLIGQRVAMRRR